MPQKSKQQALDRVAEEIRQCLVCQKGKTGLAVPGEGNPDANIVFLGEAPGKEEAKTGRPFIGRSGKLLREMIGKLGIRPEDVFITSPVKYLPTYITPTPDDIAHGKIHLEEQLSIIQPAVIVLLGRVAALAALGSIGPVLKKHGTVISKDGRNYFLTIHPAAPLYAPKMKVVIEEDFKILRLFLKQQFSLKNTGMKTK